MAARVIKLGPGELTIGEVGTEVDFTCQVTAAHVDWDVDEGDTTQVLCGETVAGERTYSARLAGTIFQDFDAPGGLVEFSWAQKGTEQPFSFIPSTLAAKKVTGTIVLDPLSVGGDEAGANMTSDFDWAVIGDPILAAA